VLSAQREQLAMSRLLKYFRKSPVPSKSKGTHVILSSLVNPIDAAEPAKGIMALDNGQLRLPPELLILIMTYIHRKRDLASLCMVSQMFRNIAAPMLYRIVEIEPKGSDVDIAGHLILYRTLQDDRYSQFVIEFHCTIRRQAVCVNYVHSTVKSHNSSRCCSCDDYDRALGKALLCLSNLQVLDLQCQLCPLVHFHDYLHSLQAPKLRELTLTLTCCGANSVEGPSKEPKSILLAPYMRNIAALALSCGYDWLRGKTMEYGQYPLEADILLNLRTLGHNGLDICDYLLMARPIERMCIAHASWEETPRLHHTISLSPGKLSHLFMANILGWLPRAMEEGLEPYRHLRYVGTIVFSRLEVFNSYLRAF